MALLKAKQVPLIGTRGRRGASFPRSQANAARFFSVWARLSFLRLIRSIEMGVRRSFYRSSSFLSYLFVFSVQCCVKCTEGH